MKTIGFTIFFVFQAQYNRLHRLGAGRLFDISGSLRETSQKEKGKGGLEYFKTGFLLHSTGSAQSFERIFDPNLRFK